MTGDDVACKGTGVDGDEAMRKDEDGGREAADDLRCGDMTITST